MPSSRDADVIVVGAGNAGFCAAHAAAERGARVLLLEKAPARLARREQLLHGGRHPHRPRRARRRRCPARRRRPARAGTELPPYPAATSPRTCAAVTEGRNDPELAELLIARPSKTAALAARQGHAAPADVRAAGLRGRRPPRVLGRPPSARWTAARADRARAPRRRGERRRDPLRHAVTGLIRDGGAVTGVAARDTGGARSRSRAGGRARRRRLRGRPGRARDVPGRRLGRGQGARHPATTPARCSTRDRRRCAPVRRLERLSQRRVGRRCAGHRRPRADEPAHAPVVSARPRRQPRRRALPRRGRRLPQLHLRQVRRARSSSSPAASPSSSSTPDRAAAAQGRVRHRPASPARGETVEELADALGIDPAGSTHGRGVQRRDHRRPFDPAVKDGKRTRARPAEVELGHAARHAALPRLPGHLRDHLHLRRRARGRPSAACSTPHGAAVPGLHAAGEMVGGLFFHNYPGGTGLMSGAVFGRRAGASAAALAARGGAAARTPRQRDSHLSIERSKEESRQ